MGIVEDWNEFRAMAYADELLIAVGALLLIVGVIRIVKSSLTMLFWVILSGLGLTAISQGLDQSPFQLAQNHKDQVGDYIGAGKELSADVLAVLCKKLDENSLLEQPNELQINEN